MTPSRPYLKQRMDAFRDTIKDDQLTYMRCVTSPAGRQVEVEDPFIGKKRQMLMFASNNYLGMANHPHVNLRVERAIREYGSGIGGPPLLNGYIKLIRETEERMAAFKGDEASMLFSSGFMANIGFVGGLATADDIILYDALSHASLRDGLKLVKAEAIRFAHNDLEELESLLADAEQRCKGMIFVCVEGVYSMDGDLGRLDLIVPLCKKYGAMLVVDDAHGTGVLGDQGQGTAAHIHCVEDVDINMGTFSKAFAACGGFLSASAEIIDFLRFHARSYVFSASPPPTVAAAILGALEVMEYEPWRRTRLLENAGYATELLEGIEMYAQPQAAVISLKLPEGMNIRKAAYLFHQKDIFINAIEYPAVDPALQRFRVSLMSDHTKEDIQALAQAVREVWIDPAAYPD